MPFARPGEGIDTGPSSAVLRVDPDRVLQLKADLQPIFDRVENFLNTKARAMIMQPLGADPVSRETADAFNQNAQSALDAAFGYRDELERVIDALDQVARTYNLVEDSNTQTFQQSAQ